MAVGREGRPLLYYLSAPGISPNLPELPRIGKPMAMLGNFGSAKNFPDFPESPGINFPRDFPVRNRSQLASLSSKRPDRRSGLESVRRSGGGLMITVGINSRFVAARKNNATILLFIPIILKLI